MGTHQGMRAQRGIGAHQGMGAHQRMGAHEGIGALQGMQPNKSDWKKAVHPSRLKPEK